MTERSFNLVDQPWIRVIDNSNGQETVVSLKELFENASNYKELAGEMRSQDLAILRLLLAILTTVYSRVDVNGDKYDWLGNGKDGWYLEDDEIDYDEVKKKLLTTWKNIYENGSFTEAVSEYLDDYHNRFDLFGEFPFYQVTGEVYDNWVPSTKKIAKGKGTVAVKQINRLISESNNSPAIFTPETNSNKEKLSLPEFARWLITYQNFTGVTDKTKVEAKNKFSVSAGWIYSIDPVLAKGNTLFDTLMLNLVLLPLSDNGFEEQLLQYPVWEENDINTYIKGRLKASVPENIAELYTVWSRMLHVEWTGDQPLIFTAGLPKFSGSNAFIEPMTTWKYDKKLAEYRPNIKWIKSLGKQMWRNFGQYVATEPEDYKGEPGIVKWLNILKDEEILSDDFLINLETVGLVSDGNATSQSPAAEVYENMCINSSVLFDKGKLTFWPKRIEDTIDLTQRVGDDFWKFARDLGNLRGLDNASDFASLLSAKFYDNLNQPFKNWMAELRIDQEPDIEIEKWKDQLQRIVSKMGKEVLKSATQKDIVGISDSDGKNTTNIFTLYNSFKYFVHRDLE